MMGRIARKIHYWRIKYIGNHTFHIIASIIAGMFSALATVILKILVHQLHRIPEYLSRGPSFNIWYLFLPLTGIIITVTVTKFLLKGKLEKGLGNIILGLFQNPTYLSVIGTFSDKPQHFINRIHKLGHRFMKNFLQINITLRMYELWIVHYSLIPYFYFAKVTC